MIKKAKIPYLLSVIIMVAIYLLHPYLWKGAFYHVTALSFCLVHYSQYLQTKGKFSLVVFIVFIVTLNNLADELFFDPTKMDYNELFSAALIAFIVFVNRRKWIIS